MPRLIADDNYLYAQSAFLCSIVAYVTGCMMGLACLKSAMWLMGGVSSAFQFVGWYFVSRHPELRHRFVQHVMVFLNMVAKLSWWRRIGYEH